MDKVILYTDGACSGNPGPGGWASILIYGKNQKELSGGLKNTTNNVMELTAVIEGLKALKHPCEVDIYSDSAYIVNAFNENWIDTWILNGWKNSKKEEVKNIDLWKELIELSHVHKIKFNKVKGHSNVMLNNRCDSLARKEAEKYSDN